MLTVSNINALVLHVEQLLSRVTNLQQENLSLRARIADMEQTEQPNPGAAEEKDLQNLIDLIDDNISSPEGGQ